jgi:hypothetical protein
MKGNRLAGVAAMSLLTIWLLTTWGPASPGQVPVVESAGKQMEKVGVPAQRTRMAWEYKTFYAGTRDDHDEALNKLGEEGWELVAVADDPRNMYRYVLKRHKQR